MLMLVIMRILTDLFPGPAARKLAGSRKLARHRELGADPVSFGPTEAGAGAAAAGDRMRLIPRAPVKAVPSPAGRAFREMRRKPHR
jgi:hypothetical protein